MLAKAKLNFIHNLIEQDFQDATKAYQRAYPKASEESARRAASRLLTKVDTQQLLASELKAILAERRQPLEKRILDVWMVRAFFDPTEILDLHGNLKITEEDLRKKGLHVCIDSINRKLNAQGQSYLEYKLADRDKALDMLQKYIAMIKEPDKNLNLVVGAGVLRVPEKLTPEEWAAAAMAQQGAISEASHE